MSRRAWSAAAPALVILALQVSCFRMPLGAYVLGLTLGLVGALVAVGMALVYRANRILNFAQPDLGTVPAVVAVDLLVFGGVNVVLAFTAGLAAAVVCGGLVELLIIRRLADAPRLMLTVATIGISQLLLVGAAAVPLAWGEDGRSTAFRLLDGWSFELAPVTVNAIHVITLVVAPLVMLGVGELLRRTATGVAIRASAESAERARLLGVPVARLNTLVWVLAAVLSFVGVFLRAGLVGLPAAGQMSYLAALSALAAVMLGGLTRLPSVALSAVAIGVLEQGVTWNNGGRPGVFVLVLAAIIVVGPLLRRVGSARVEQDRTSSWSTGQDVRPLSDAVRGRPAVRAATGALLAMAMTAAVFGPVLLSDGARSRAAALAIFGIVGVSVVLLTGWAGQVSLGQFGFVAIGSVVTAYGTIHWRLDLSLCLVLAALAGAAASVVIGLPALRLRGLFLAVTTLAFAAAVNTYLLSTKYFPWIPQDRFARRPLFGLVDVSGELAFYEVCLAALVLTCVASRGLRRSRTGRVLLAVRENERGSQAFGVSIVRAKLLAFALSGALASFAGGLLVYLQQRYADQIYDPTQSFNVFTSTVVGGPGSIVGAFLGSAYLNGATWFLKPPWALLPSAVGVLFVLLSLRGGFGGLVLGWRDRWVARLVLPATGDEP